MKDERILQWIVASGIKTDKAEPFELSKHSFLKEILTDFSKRIVVRKCSQVGLSLTFILKILYLAYLYKDKKLLSVLFTLPTSDVMADFVRTKFDPIVFNSSLKEFAEGISPKEKIYSVQLKKIFGSFFFFRGASSVSSAQSVAGDVLICDEFDFQNQTIKTMFEERLTGSSSLGYAWFLSVPYLPKYGVSAIFEESTQNEWWIECPNCHKLQTLTWPESIDQERKIYICKHCESELPDSARQRGIWKPKYPNREISGYSISRLMAPWISAEQLLESKRKNDEAHFYRYALGLPYKSKESAKILDNFSNLIYANELENAKKVVGIDQGNHFHTVLLKIKPGLRVVEDLNEFSNHQDLIDYLAFIKPDLAIMEGLPAKHLALIIQKKFGKSKFLVLSEQNFAITEDAVKLDSENGRISVDRTQMIDNAFYLMDLKVIRWRKGISKLDELKQHLSNLIPVDKVFRGVQRKFYEKVGQSDYSFALFFANVGANLIYPFEEQQLNLDEIRDQLKPLTEEEYMKKTDERDFEKAIERAERQQFNLDSTILIRPKGL